MLLTVAAHGLRAPCAGPRCWGPISPSSLRCSPPCRIPARRRCARSGSLPSLRRAGVPVAALGGLAGGWRAVAAVRAGAAAYAAVGALAAPVLQPRHGVP
ncbi:MAG: hypothetical protein RML45_11645 [Acetobacteraceae bacterium]|nr:hypothetical protein [Acetobacteraceae bacterium]